MARGCPGHRIRHLRCCFPQHFYEQLCCLTVGDHDSACGGFYLFMLHFAAFFGYSFVRFVRLLFTSIEIGKLLFFVNTDTELTENRLKRK